MENDEQIKQACYLAALRYFELDPVNQYRPLLSDLRLTEAERARYTHKISVMIADQAAIVYRAGPGHYEVVGDEEDPASGDQVEDEEAGKILLAAAEYLEVNPRQARSLKTRKQTVPTGATYQGRYTLTINGLSCLVVRHDRESGPEYTILEE